MSEKKINDRVIRLVKGDITDMEVEAFVFYASEDLKLGTGFGGAISVRGGPTIQKALDEIGGAKLTESVITEAGNMKAKYIVHAVGPKFQEPDEERKLRDTIKSVLKVAEDKGIKQLAFPPMGCGFYGIPWELSARVMDETLTEHLGGQTGIHEVVICLRDTREYQPFQARFQGVD